MDRGGSCSSYDEAPLGPIRLGVVQLRSCVLDALENFNMQEFVFLPTLAADRETSPGYR